MDILEAARKLNEDGAALRRACACSGTMDIGQRSAFAALAAQTISDLGWILGRNYGDDTVVGEVETAATFVPEPAVIIDVGANAGHWSRAALVRFPSARIVAFEPQTIHASKLEALAAEHPSRFQFRSLALSDCADSLPIYANEPGSGLASLYKRDLLKFYNVEMVPQHDVAAETLFSELQKLDIVSVDILKIDVEGHELAVLRGAGEAISSIKYIQFEYGGAMMDSKICFRDFVSFFFDHGFRLHRMSPIGPVSILAYAEALEGFEMSNYLATNSALI